MSQFLTEEEKDAHNRMIQSDMMLCTNIEHLHFRHKYETDVPYMHLLSKPIPCCVRDVKEEYKLLTESYETRKATCDESVMTRGGNHKPMNKYKNTQVGYDYFNTPLNSELLMIPCKENNVQNYIVQDDKKTCSASHQLFNNMTKRV
jgi:hypothetical protein